MKNILFTILGFLVGVLCTNLFFTYSVPTDDQTAPEYENQSNSSVVMGNETLSFEIPAGWKLIDADRTVGSSNYVLVSPGASFSREYASPSSIVGGAYIEIDVTADDGYKKRGLNSAEEYYSWYMDFYKDVKELPTGSINIDGFTFLEYDNSVFGVIKDSKITAYFNHDDTYQSEEVKNYFKQIIASFKITDRDYQY